MPRKVDRRTILQGMTWGASTLALAPIVGCTSPPVSERSPDLVWGIRGLSEGRFLKPRAIAIDRSDHLYIVDTTGRIQVFDVDGNYLRGWKTPETENGRPTGLFVDQEDQLLVADTHYHRLLTYTLDGNLKAEQTLGGISGTIAGQFAFVTDATRDSQGRYYVGDYGDADRIQQFTPDRTFISQWGGTGEEPGQLIRPQSLAMDADDQLWVADACNHRIQVFDTRSNPPQLVKVIGSQGPSPGQLQYPYGLAFDRQGTLWVCEYGNQRVQQFDPSGRSLSTWGTPGKAAGELYQPWGLVVDSQNRLHILDSNNHRVQRLLIS